MYAYLAAWAVTFTAILLALIATALIYQRMGDGLELNGWVAETMTALVVSAAQAGAYLLSQGFPTPHPPTFHSLGGSSIAVSAFLGCLWFGYKITHLTTWDPLEFLILGLVDCGLAFVAAVALG